MVHLVLERYCRLLECTELYFDFILLNASLNNNFKYSTMIKSILYIVNGILITVWICWVQITEVLHNKKKKEG